MVVNEILPRLAVGKTQLEVHRYVKEVLNVDVCRARIGQIAREKKYQKMLEALRNEYARSLLKKLEDNV